MQKITMKSYAIKHKLSMFNVIKMVKSKKLNTIVEQVEDKEITYILLDSHTEEEVIKQIKYPTLSKEQKIELELEQLKEEINLLKQEIAWIKTKL